MIKVMMLIAPLAILVFGCSVPMTPEEYRKAAKSGNARSTYESFEVNRPQSEVAATLKEKAAECLDYEIGSTKRPVVRIGSSTHYYGVTKQTVLKSKNKVELYFQVKYDNSTNHEPEGGSYHLVADAYAVGKTKTRVAIYRKTKVTVLGQAIRGWATGEDLGCPDPAQYL